MKASRRQRIRFGITFISFLLFPITIYYFSPYLIVQGAFEGVLVGSAIMFGILLLAALVLRRGFCGWVCPAGGLQEAERRIVDKPMCGTKKNTLKWIIWVPWMAAIVAGAIVAGGINSVDVLYNIEGGISVTDLPALVIYLIIVALFFIPNLFLGRRAMCHCICWMAPFMIIGEKLGHGLRIPQLHVGVAPDSCIQCGKCTASCPMSLPVQSLVEGSAAISDAVCIQCAACCDVCPNDVLKLKIGRF